MIEGMAETTFDEIVNKYVEMNVAHPFMEGNGRSTRIWLDLIFKARLKLCVDWSKIDKKAYLSAMKQSTTDARAIKSLLQGAMTDRIDDREIFMKGIDYSLFELCRRRVLSNDNSTNRLSESKGNLLTLPSVRFLEHSSTNRLSESVSLYIIIVFINDGK